MKVVQFGFDQSDQLYVLHDDGTLWVQVIKSILKGGYSIGTKTTWEQVVTWNKGDPSES